MRQSKVTQNVYSERALYGAEQIGNDSASHRQLCGAGRFSIIALYPVLQIVNISLRPADRLLSTCWN
jgi:hypothetical protein